MDIHNKRDRILSDEEWSRLQEKVTTPLLPMIQLSWYTGMRQGEILSLEWSQVDFEKQFIHLRADQTKNTTARTVFLEGKALEVIKKIPKDLRCLKYIFVSATGNPYTRFTGTLQRMWRKGCDLAQVEDFVPDNSWST